MWPARIADGVEAPPVACIRGHLVTVATRSGGQAESVADEWRAETARPCDKLVMVQGRTSCEEETISDSGKEHCVG